MKKLVKATKEDMKRLTNSIKKEMKKNDIRNAAELRRFTGNSISWEIARDIIECRDSVKLGNIAVVAKCFNRVLDIV